MRYDFDCGVDRREVPCVKVDGMAEYFGHADLLPMWVADMDFAVCPDIVAALRHRLEHPVFGYPRIVDGYWQSIIDWLQRRHGLHIERDWLTAVGGVVRALGLCVNRLSKPGDGIVVQQPVYYPFNRVITGNGRRVLNNPLVRTADGYRMDIEGLQRLVETERPSMMLLCNPHNPIGLQWDEATLRAVADIADRASMIVVADEIHGDLMPRGTHHVPFISISDAARRCGVMLGAPSKTFNIPGLVSSWMVIPNPKIRQPFYAWLEVNELGSPAEFAALATEAAYTHGDAWLDPCMDYVTANADYVVRRFNAELPAVEALRPGASFLMWLDMRRLGLDQRQLMDRMLNVAHVAVNDGATFGQEGNGYVRLNIGAPRTTVKEAVDCIVNAFKTPQS